MLKHLHPVLALLSALALAASIMSCGDSDDSSESSSITQAQFVKEAEKICTRESDKALAQVGPYVQRQKRDGGGGQDPSKLQAEAVKAVILPSVEAQIDQIRNLGAPAGDKAQIEAFLTAMQDAVDVSKQAPLTPQANEAFSRVNTLGRAYGLERCAYG